MSRLFIACAVVGAAAALVRSFARKLIVSHVASAAVQ